MEGDAPLVGGPLLMLLLLGDALTVSPRRQHPVLPHPTPSRLPSPPHSFLFLSPYLVSPSLTHSSELRPLYARNGELIVADAEVTSAASEIRTPGDRRDEGVAGTSSTDELSIKRDPCHLNVCCVHTNLSLTRVPVMIKALSFGNSSVNEAVIKDAVRLMWIGH